MNPSELNRRIREFARTDPRAAAKAEYASVLAAALAETAGTDPLCARHAALAQFGLARPPEDDKAREVVRVACEAALGRETEEPWRTRLAEVLRIVHPCED
jgi:hypothetical protein